MADYLFTPQGHIYYWLLHNLQHAKCKLYSEREQQVQQYVTTVQIWGGNCQPNQSLPLKNYVELGRNKKNSLL